MAYYTDPEERRAYVDAFARQSFPVFVLVPARADSKMKADVGRARRIERAWRDQQQARIEAGELAPDYRDVLDFAHRMKDMLVRAEYRWACRVADVSANLEDAESRWFRAYVDAWAAARMDGNAAVSRVLYARRNAAVAGWGRSA